MILGFIVLITGLTISTVLSYYSVADSSSLISSLQSQLGSIASRHIFRKERADLKQEIDHESSNNHNKSVPADSASNSNPGVGRTDNRLYATGPAVCTARITGAAGARRDMVLHQARKQELDDVVATQVPFFRK
jgi:hypothetical protein